MLANYHSAILHGATRGLAFGILYCSQRSRTRCGGLSCRVSSSANEGFHVEVVCDLFIFHVETIFILGGLNLISDDGTHVEFGTTDLRSSPQLARRRETALNAAVNSAAVDKRPEHKAKR